MIRLGSKLSYPLNHLTSEAVLTKASQCVCVCGEGSVSPVLPATGI